MLAAMKSIVALMVMVGTAAADKPTVKEAEDFVRDHLMAAQRDDDHKPSDPKSPYRIVTAPFLHNSFSRDTPSKTGKSCGAEFGESGIVKKITPRYLDCLNTPGWSAAIDAEAFTELDLAKLPAGFTKHKARLAALAKDHRLVMSHFLPAGPAEYWTIYAFKKAGDKLALSALLTYGVEHER
jgi:hypothetical protein